MMRLLTAFLIASLLGLTPAVLPPAAAQDNDAPDAERKPMPKTLVIGYEEEGKVDASPAACMVFVKEVVEWDEAEMQKAALDVCAVRQKHLDAYTAFEAAYGKFRSALMQQIRFDGEKAARHLAHLVKSCIEMKWALSTGGHNIGIDMVPNDIDATCLDMGREILVKETNRLGIDEPQPKAGK